MSNYNLLSAIKNLIALLVFEVKSYPSGKNRINSVGEDLEEYVKDIFLNNFSLNEIERNKKIEEVFSYLGNKNNPPDIILKGGDAVEIKKVETPNTDLALNSSYPKAKIYSDDPMLTKACKNCENWTQKDIIYVIGHTKKTELKYLWFIYGDCFAAEQEIYERIKKTISNGIIEIPEVEFTETKELGKVKKVDPLGITDLRIRGMWHIQNPHKIFKYLRINNNDDDKLKFQLFVLMKKEKYQSFPLEDQEYLQKLQRNNYQCREVKIKNPNNPATLIESILITFNIY